MSVWVMPFVDVYENFLKRSQAIAGGRRRWAPPRDYCKFMNFIPYGCEQAKSETKANTAH